MQASDRFNINSQLEHLQAKYVGTGHADLNRFEWAVNIQRDSYASYVGHYPILAYFAIAENESIGREHYNFMQMLDGLTDVISGSGCLKTLEVIANIVILERNGNVELSNGLAGCNEFMDKANGMTDRFEERAVSIGHYADLDGISDQLPGSSGGWQVDIHFDGGVDELRPSRSGSVRKVFEIMAVGDFLEYCDCGTCARWLGKEIHGYAIRHGLDTNVCIGSSLINMHAKCLGAHDSLGYFCLLPLKDAISWNSIIAGCVQNGLFDEGLKFFGQMLMAKIKAGHVPFSRIMHAGSTENVWLTLLSACRVHGNVELAEKVADMILMIDPNNTGAYVILSAARIWKDAASSRVSMRNKGMKMTPACSWIEVKNKAYAFVAGDESHPYYHRINEALKDLLERMEQEGRACSTGTGNGGYMHHNCVFGEHVLNASLSLDLCNDP
ncbi:hypothetical protein WN944_026026 [Citrus x changshan-huyou]